MDTVPPRTPRHIWLDAPLRLKGLVVVAIPVAFLLLATGLFYHAGYQQAQADTRVRHTLRVQDTLQRILTQMVDLETGVRGYLLTKDQKFLEPFTQGRKKLPALFNAVKLLVANDPAQQHLLQHLQVLYNEDIQIRTAQIKYGAASASARPPLDLLIKAKSVMDRARKDLAGMRANEEAALQERYETSNRTRTRQQFIAALCAILGITGGSLAALLFTTGVAHRVRLLEDNAHRLASESPLLPFGDGNDEIGHLGQTLGQTSDLLAERRSDLQESQSRLQALFAHTQDAIFLLTSKACLTDVNPAAETLTGYSSAEIQKHFLWDIMMPVQATEQQAREEKAHWRSFLEEGRMSGESAVRRKAGNTVAIEYHAVANILPDLHLFVARDITERKLALASLLQAREEAERANQAKSEFMSRVSHELRTPLNAILGFAQLLQMDDAAPNHRDGLDQILKGGRHLLHLINEVLDIARVESGELSLSSEPILVREVFREAVDLIQPLALTKHIQIDAHTIDTCELYASADRQRLKQVVLNLLSNAVKFNHDGGHVAIDCTADDNQQVILRVSDSGQGIPEDKLHRLFTPFDRLGAEQSMIEGTGLGLSLSKGLVEAMKGAITVQSTVGEGTTFLITLPIAQNPVQQVEEAGQKLSHTADMLPSADDRKILYIEDNLPNLKVVEYILARLPKTELISAMQGGLGFELACRHRPSLILLDLHLPDTTGSEVLARLQAHPRTRSIPVVVISADATQKQIDRLLQAGAFAYITKPIDVNQFLQILQEVLGRKQDES